MPVGYNCVQRHTETDNFIRNGGKGSSKFRAGKLEKRVKKEE